MRESQSQRMEARVVTCSRHDMDVALMDSLNLWLPAQHQSNTPAGSTNGTWWVTKRGGKRQEVMEMEERCNM